MKTMPNAAFADLFQQLVGADHDPNALIRRFTRRCPVGILIVTLARRFRRCQRGMAEKLFGPFVPSQ